MTDDKIREAFEKWKDDYALVCEPNHSKATEEDCRAAYKAGYLAMLNSLEQVEIIDDDGFVAIVYSLPEGVSRDE